MTGVTLFARVTGHGGHHALGIGLLAIVVIGLAAFGATRWRDRRRNLSQTEAPWPNERHPDPSIKGPAPAAAGVSPAPAPSTGTAGPSPSVHAAGPARPADATEPPQQAWPSGPARRLAASPAGWAVETHGLTKRFGANVAIDDVELLVPRGCAFGCLGPNGAGKTTLIRTLLGLTHPDAGSMAILGLPVPAERSRALARVGAIVDEPRFHTHLTGRENLTLLAAARGEGADRRIEPALRRVGLGERADHRVGAYSMGMRQRLGVAACLLGDPELLILDEPMNGLDPAGMHEMRGMIRTLVDEGRTVMLSSHLLDEVERTCDAVAIVDHGRVVRQGPIDELIRSAGTLAVRLECSDPEGAARLIAASGLATRTAPLDGGLAITLVAGATRDSIAALNRALVEGGVAVYGIQEQRTSLEEWFLAVTSRLGAAQ